MSSLFHGKINEYFQIIEYKGLIGYIESQNPSK